MRGLGGSPMLDYLTYTSLLGIIVSLVCITIAWWALQIFRFDLFTHNPNSPQTKTLQVILSIVLGYLLAEFFISFIGWSLNLGNLIG